MIEIHCFTNTKESLLNLHFLKTLDVVNSLDNKEGIARVFVYMYSLENRTLDSMHYQMRSGTYDFFLHF